jgi:hypothetical protein
MSHFGNYLAFTHAHTPRNCMIAFVSFLSSMVEGTFCRALSTRDTILFATLRARQVPRLEFLSELDPISLGLALSP